MQLEHRRLEEELEHRVDQLRRSRVSGTSQAQNEMQRLVLEREVLRQESIELRQEIAKYLKFQQIIQSSSEKQASQTPSNYLTSDSDSAGTFTVRRVESEWKPVEEHAGRRVDFPGGEPSFFFHPFSRQEFDEILSSQQQKFAGSSGNLALAGKFLGWEVLHAPVAAAQGSKSFLGWSRYSKRVQSSVDQIQKAMSRPDGSNEWPMLSSARNLGRMEDVTAQTLQKLDENSRVVVSSYPGKVCYRYLGLAQCAKWQEVDGKHVLTYSFVISDSEANARSRSAEPNVHQNVCWVQEGGAFLTLTEIDDGAVDVQFNHWACWSSELQAQSHFITFGHLVTRWEQLVSPSRLLTVNETMIVAVLPKKGSKRGQPQWKLADEVDEDEKQRKQRVHREEMVLYRQRKKNREAQLRAEHRELELELERHVAPWKVEASKTRGHTDNRAVPPLGGGDDAVANLHNQVRGLILQAEALRLENKKLRVAVADHDPLPKVIYAESDRLVRDSHESVLGGEGWRVNFANGEPSFHYHPFSKDECAAIVQKYDALMSSEKLVGCGGFTEVGSLLGWRVERAPLVCHSSGKCMVARAKFTKRIKCVAGESNQAVDRLAAQSWSVLSTPELYSSVHRAGCVSLKLQEIDEDTTIMVSSSAPHSRGGRHLRHLIMMRRSSATDEQGRRVINYMMVIPDSLANKRSREAEDSRDEVLWVCQGGANMTLKQIDDSTLEVAYDNCSGCRNGLHAQHLLVEWGHEAIRWEQLATPAKLLAI